MRIDRPLARNVTILDDGEPIMSLNRENFLVIDEDGTLNAMYRDKEDETRLIVTMAVSGERMFMVANRTKDGVPQFVPEVLRDMFMPARAGAMMGMQNGDCLMGVIALTLPGSYYKPDELKADLRN